ncbi:hypothetical protein BSPP4475_17185 [Brevibacillus aydinogluensis]|uniref:Uncharacterized protein n=1 Tax=Brevibacillus aydinogluensis TaxID=927786 RepID=A0AA48RJ08_9BACL|nr:hypothetical protein BSPP4475_17185 [Brevibacillus aydinogluensis]
MTPLGVFFCHYLDLKKTNVRYIVNTRVIPERFTGTLKNFKKFQFT